MCLDLDREAQQLERESARLVREQVKMILMILKMLIMMILMMMMIRKRDSGTWTGCASSGEREQESRSTGRTAST